MRLTADGGVEFELVDGEGNTRYLKLLPTSSGTLRFEVENENGERNTREIDPTGGDTALGK